MENIKEIESKQSIKKRSSLFNLFFTNKQFLINPRFQLRFIFSIIAFIVFTMGMVYFSQEYFFRVFMLRGETLELPSGHPFYALLHEQRAEMIKIYVTVSFLSGLSAFIWGLIYSHKIAGPLYRLCREFKTAADDNRELKSLNFREGDLFQEIPDSVNSYLRGKQKADKKPLKKSA